jgi:hypothetical protein
MTEQADRRWGARSISSLLLFILATVILVPALVGHWGYRTVIDSERYIATVGPLIDQPEVQQALADAVTQQVVTKVDTESQVDTLLGNLFPNAGFTNQLAAPIAAGINGLIGELVTRFVQSDQFATVWVDLNKAAQKGVVAVLEGHDGGVVSLQGDQLVLDTSQALTAIQTFLVDQGITAAANITIPDTDREIVLADAPGLAQIRTIYGLTSPILAWLPVIVVVLFGASILLARRRARTSVATGIVLLVSGVVVALALNAGETTFDNHLSGTPWGPAAGVFWTTLLAYLVTGVQAAIVLGIVIILAGWFGGRTRLARMARGPITTGLAQLGGGMSGGRPGPMPRTMLPYARWLAIAVGVLILLVSDLMSISTVLWTAALVAGLVTLAQLLAGPGSATSGAEPVAVDSAGAAVTAPTVTSTPVAGSNDSE